MKKINLICVIDDDDIYTFLIKRIIQHAEVAEKSIFFKNGMEALQFFMDKKMQPEELPELILLDINMPILDGWQFLAGYTQLVPVIEKDITLYMTSSSDDKDDYDRAMSIGPVKDFIRKPIDTDVLRKLVDEM
ncbi:two-component system response regulator [Dyadobacter sp. CY356]|uniref:response regulator n=1 Tax=Dyadobacter sp. CY356 TaxID=2906442 RepID=UPI001F3B6BC3|nr:response regulator [Dyadobacter sp. CY356]MCF0055986.1 response regulator [Dyadobacter sp. CY356]